HPHGESGEDRGAPADRMSARSAAPWLGEIAEQLQRDPEERWRALEALSAVEPAARRAIIAELSALWSESGVRSLLRLLSTTRDALTREAARLALLATGGEAFEAPGQTAPAPRSAASDDVGSPCGSHRIRAVDGSTRFG